jgi:hypothetical protein
VSAYETDNRQTSGPLEAELQTEAIQSKHLQEHRGNIRELFSSSLQEHGQPFDLRRLPQRTRILHYICHEQASALHRLRIGLLFGHNEQVAQDRY